jgi:hypothetical protein
MMQTDHHHPERRGLSLTAAAGEEGNSSFIVVPLLTTSFLGSTDTSRRVETSVEYLVSLKLNILYQGNAPTFVISSRKEIDY